MCMPTGSAGLLGTAAMGLGTGGLALLLPRKMGGLVDYGKAAPGPDDQSRLAIKPENPLTLAKPMGRKISDSVYTSDTGVGLQGPQS